MRRAAPGCLALALGIGAAGCKGNGVENVPPAIEVQNTSGAALKSLAFAATAFGTTSTQQFQVASIATVDAHVTLALSGPQASLFAVTPPATSLLTVPAGTNQLFTVTFAPVLPSPIPTGNVLESATITLTSDDPNNPTVTIPISAVAAAPQLDLCWAQTPTTEVCLSQGPVTIPFGSIADGGPIPFEGTAPPQEIDVINRSDVPLTLSSIALDAAATTAGFSIVEQTNTPVVLSAASGESLIMHVALTPKQSGSLTGNFQVTGNDPRLSGPASVALSATGQPAGAPTACLGIYEIAYGTGQVVAAPQLNAAEPLSAQPSIVSPGPLDTAYFTAEPSPTCSDDPQDGQNMFYQFTLATPPGSMAALVEVNGHTDEQTVLFDLPGLYTVTLLATDSAGLTATAQLPLLVKPHDDISVQLSWQSAVPVDLDLHFVRVVQPDAGTNPLNELNVATNPTNDCYYADCLPSFDYPPPPPAVPYVDWNDGTTGVWSTGDPLLEAQVGEAPLNSEALDVVDLSNPQPGADYDVFVLYYNPSNGQPGVNCATSSECTDPAYPTCLAISDGGECIPAASAVVRTFVEGQELDAGAPLTLQLNETCDLWWAGTVHWIGSAIQLSDGGAVPPQFSFTANTATDGGFLTISGTPQAGGCVPPP
jgi:hypothetical protein